MKYRLFLAILGIAMLSFGSSYCQVANELFNPNDSTAPKPLLGIRLGANFQGITGSDWVQAVNTGVVGGFYAGMHKNKVGVQLEILASTTKYKSKITIDTDGNIANFNVTYLNIPLLLNYNILPHLMLQVGPEYNNIVSVTKNSTLYADPKVLFKSSGFAGVIGLEAKLPHQFNAGARYSYSFSNMNNLATTSAETWGNWSAQVYVGYSIK